MPINPRQLVSWALAIGFSFLVGLAGVALANDVWIVDFPRLRGLLSLDTRLIPIVIILFIAALPPTFVVFLLPGSRERIEFSFLGLKLKGPAAAPVLWTLVFLASAFVLTVAARVLRLG